VFFFPVFLFLLFSHFFSVPFLRVISLLSASGRLFVVVMEIVNTYNKMTICALLPGSALPAV